MLFLDANVIVSGVAGPAQGPSALIVATIRLGGFVAVTVENAMDEARRHLLELFNRNRLKISPAETDRELTALREAEAFTVHPWITAGPEVWPDNPKDAYLLAAIEEHAPTWLLTGDDRLLAIGNYRGTKILTPRAFLEEMKADDR